MENTRTKYYISAYLTDDKKLWGVSIIEQISGNIWGNKKTRREFKTVVSKKVKYSTLKGEIKSIKKEFLEHSINIPISYICGPDNNEVKKCCKKLNEKSIPDMVSKIKKKKDEIQNIDEDIKKILESSDVAKIDDIEVRSRIQGIYKFVTEPEAIFNFLKI